MKMAKFIVLFLAALMLAAASSAQSAEQEPADSQVQPAPSAQEESPDSHVQNALSGKRPLPVVRMYGGEKSFWDKSWEMPGLVKVK